MKFFLILTVLFLSTNLVFAQVDKRIFDANARAAFFVVDYPLNFLLGTVQMDAVSKENLVEIVAELKTFPAGTVLEIGAHTSDLGSRQANSELTEKRAVAVRDALIALGVNPKALTAKGYGNEKSILKREKSELDRQVNTRLEFRVTMQSFRENFEVVAKNPSNPKEPVRTAEDERVLSDFENYEKMSPIIERILKEGLNNKPDEQVDKIVAGKGLGKVFIGATQEQIESALGEPETFIEGNMLLPNSSAFYYSRGIVVVYDAQTNLVKTIDFVGDPAYLNAKSYEGTFQTVQATPDKNIKWGTNLAQIVAAYGEPKHKLTDKGNNPEVTLTYDQITFTLREDKLYYIVVAADNNRFLNAMKKQADEQPEKDRYAAAIAAAAKPLDYEAQYVIAPGKGTNKIYLGASRAEIEAAFGKPDEFVDGKADIFRIYEAHYFSKGVQIEYDPETKIATSILFFGDTAKSEAFGRYKLFPGITDRAIRWGVSPANVMRIYGKPVEERTRYNPKLDKDYESITYPNVAFGFTENRLVYIANDKIWGNKK